MSEDEDDSPAQAKKELRMKTNKVIPLQMLDCSFFEI
jgi:hypothetical protein